MRLFAKILLAATLLTAALLAALVLFVALIFSGGASACDFLPDPSQVSDNAGGIKIGNQPLSGEQIGNANTIIRVGASRKEGQLRVKLALMVAIQESHLVNLHYGDLDSLGLFQQRAGWGSVQQRLNPTYATNAFFDALDKVPNADKLLGRGKFLTVALLVQRPSRAAYLNPRNYFPDWTSVADLLLGIAPGSHHPGSTIISPCGGLDTGVKGKVEVAPGANASGRPIKPETLAFAAKVAGIYGKPLICTTGTNHTYLTANGNVSDHSSGHACDFGMIANGGSDDSPVGDAIAAACLIAANDPSVVPRPNALAAARRGGIWDLHDRKDNLRIQCIWKAPDHHDHVHIGARPWAEGDVTGKVG